MRRIFIFLIVVLLFVQGASAWGMSPARQRAEISSTTQFLSVTLENDQGLEGYFKISFSGDLSEYANYNGPVIYIDSSMSEYIVPFTLAMPEELNPGKHSLQVNIEQIPGGGATATMSSLIKLVADVVVEVPVHGNFIGAKVSVGTSEVDSETPITISLVNKGESAVAVWADVVIKGPTNVELASWSTEKKVIEYVGTGKITTQWDAVKEPGMYVAEIVLHYGDKFLVKRESFVVGKKEVVAETLSSAQFNLGSIVPVEIVVRNKWNEDVKEVFAEVYVLADNGNILQSFKTASESVQALGKATLQGYWDTAKLVVGSYDLNVVVNFDGGQSQQSYPATVKMDELEVNGVTGNVVKEKSSFSQNSLFIVLLLILVITNVVIIMYFRKMKKK